MPHGRPDYFNLSPIVQIHATEDVGELAVRLGSFDSYDRRGNVLYMHSFADGLGAWGFTPSTALADYYLYLHGFTAPGASFVVESSASGGYATFSLYLAEQASGTMGLEVCFGIDSGASYFQVSFSHYYNLYRYSYILKADIANNKLQVYTPSGFVNVDDLPLFYKTYTNLTYMKLCVDLDNRKYLRGLFNQSAYSLIDYTPYSTYSGVSGRLIIEIKPYFTASAGNKCALHYAIVTINE